MPTITRSDLVRLLALRFPQLAPPDSDAAVKAILGALGDALARGRRVEIRGFGSFHAGQRLPRTARNPRTGERVAIPGRRVAHFRAGKALREAIAASAPEHPEQ